MKLTNNFKALLRKFRAGGGILFLRTGAPVAPDGIYVSFPDYSVNVGDEAGGALSNIHVPLGHGMSIAVDEKTGHTRGSEYGRYAGKLSSTYGNAHRVRVPDFHFAGNEPTQAELDAYGETLLRSYQNLHGANKVGNTIKLVYNPDISYEDVEKAQIQAETQGIGAPYSWVKGRTCGSVGYNQAFGLPLTTPQFGTPGMIGPTDSPMVDEYGHPIRQADGSVVKPRTYKRSKVKIKN